MFLISPKDHYINKNKGTLKSCFHYAKNKKGEIIKFGWKFHIGDTKEAINASSEEIKQFKNEKGEILENIYYITEWNGDSEAEDFDCCEENFICVKLAILDKPRSFNYSGNLWCHLNQYVTIKHEHIIKIKGEWILLSFANWLKYYNYAKISNDYRSKPKFFEQNCNNYPNDYFEVFIEKV
jgi:hypothetical protein